MSVCVCECSERDITFKWRIQGRKKRKENVGKEYKATSERARERERERPGIFLPVS